MYYSSPMKLACDVMYMVVSCQTGLVLASVKTNTLERLFLVDVMQKQTR